MNSLTRAVVPLALSACIALTIGGCATIAPADTSHDAASAADIAPSSAMGECESTEKVPFNIDGLCVADVVEVTGDEPVVSSVERWSFGGDYSRLGVVPLDHTSVFVSYSDTPDDIRSYATGVLHEDGTLTPVGDVVVDDGTYIEPHGGTASSDWVVWLGGPIATSEQTANAEDPWRIFAWPRSGATRAQLVADSTGLGSTLRMTDAATEYLPTASGRAVYFPVVTGRITEEGRAEQEVEIGVFPLPGEGTKIAETRLSGRFAAAFDGGALIASGEDSASPATLLNTFDEESGKSAQFASLSGEGWKFSGVWAAGEQRAALVTQQAGDDSWMLTWTDGSVNTRLFHTKSTVLTVSMSAQWIAWDGVEQADTWIGRSYVGDLRTGVVTRASVDQGTYSPSLASDSSALLVAHNDGMSPSTWEVIALR